MFRRKRREDPAEDEAAPDAAEVEESEPATPERPAGPWDVDDVPEDGVQRADLGALRIPALPGTQLRLEVDASGRPVSANVVSASGGVQLTVFAAPRTAGIWDDVREEIRAGLASGGAAEDTTGPFGPELAATVGAEVPGRGRVATPARFLGVDGPRWFLRAVITGAAAQDPEQAALLEDVVRGAVVVRGDDPRPVREPLPLVLPPELAEQAEQRAQQLREAQAATAQQQQAAQRAQQEANQREISRRAQSGEAAPTGGTSAPAPPAPAAAPQPGGPPPAAGAADAQPDADDAEPPGRGA